MRDAERSAAPSIREHAGPPWRVVAWLLLGIAVVGLVFAALGVEDLAGAIRRVPWPHMLGIVLLTVPLVFVRVARARILLHPRPSWTTLFPILNASFLLAIVTPGRAGALLRPAWLIRHDVPVGATLLGIVAERVLDLLVISGLLLVTLAWSVEALPPELVERLRQARWLLGGSAVAGALLLLVLPRLWGPISSRLRGDGVLVRRLRALVSSGVEAASALARDPARTAAACGWTALSWSLGLSMGALVVHAVDPMLLTPRVVVSLWTGVMLANVLSPTPGGVGAYEAVGTTILVSYGMATTPAASAVLVGHLASLGTQAAFGVHGLVVMARGAEGEADP